MLGAAMLAFAITRFSADTPFPGLWATIPALGAALLVHTGQQGDTAVSKLLGLWPCVFIGLISYSVYLWHWPIFVFATDYLGHGLSGGETLALTVATMIVATVSWWAMSSGHSATLTPRQASPSGPASWEASSRCGDRLVGLALVSAEGLPGRLGPEALRWIAVSGTEVEPSHDPTSDVLIWGDSHADALYPAAVMLGEHYGLTASEASNGGCLPLIGAHRMGDNDGALARLQHIQSRRAAEAATGPPTPRSDPRGPLVALPRQDD